jgi:hypothetical protein
MTGLRIAMSGAALLVASAVACSSDAGRPPIDWGSGGVGGHRTARGGATGECPDVTANPSFVCPPGSTAFACDLPFDAREMRVSNDHLYLTVGMDLHRVGETSLERLLDLHIGPENHDHSSLQVEEPYVYFAEANPAPTSPPAKQPILRRLLDGSDAPSVVWDCSDWTSNFIIEGDVIFTHSSNGALRIDKTLAGSRATQLLPNGFRLGWELAADDSGVYWASVEGLIRSEKTSACACACAVCAGAGGSTGTAGAAGTSGASPRCAQTSQLLSAPMFVARLVLDATWLYFVSGGELYRLAKTGGRPEALLHSTFGFTRWQIENIAATATDLYVAATVEGRPQQHLIRIPRGGGDPTVLAGTRITGRSFGPVVDMAATADAVYRLVSVRCGMELHRYRIDAQTGVSP